MQLKVRYKARSCKYKEDSISGQWKLVKIHRKQKNGSYITEAIEISDTEIPQIRNSPIPSPIHDMYTLEVNQHPTWNYWRKRRTSEHEIVTKNTRKTSMLKVAP